MKIPLFLTPSRLARDTTTRYKSKAEGGKSSLERKRRRRIASEGEKIIIIRRGLVGWPVGCSSRGRNVSREEDA